MPSELIVRSSKGKIIFQEEISESWSFCTQLNDIKLWLNQYDIIRPNSSKCYIDVGIENRIGKNNVSIQGEAIPSRLMKVLGNREIDLWISIYPEYETI